MEKNYCGTYRWTREPNGQFAKDRNLITWAMLITILGLVVVVFIQSRELKALQTSQVLTRDYADRVALNTKRYVDEATDLILRRTMGQIAELQGDYASNSSDMLSLVDNSVGLVENLKETIVKNGTTVNY